MRGAAAFVDRGRWTTHKCYIDSAVEMLTTCDGPAVIDAKNRYRSRNAIFAYPPAFYAPSFVGAATAFSVIKLVWCGYPMVKTF